MDGITQTAKIAESAKDCQDEHLEDGKSGRVFGSWYLALSSLAVSRFSTPWVFHANYQVSGTKYRLWYLALNSRPFRQFTTSGSCRKSQIPITKYQVPALSAIFGDFGIVRHLPICLL